MVEILKSLREYIQDAGAAVIAFLGGVCVLLLTLARGYLEHRWGLALPPEATIGGGILLMVWGQFWAYHQQRLRGLRQLGELTVQAAQEMRIVRQRTIQSPRPDLPEAVEVLIQTTVPITAPHLEFICTGEVQEDGIDAWIIGEQGIPQEQVIVDGTRFAYRRLDASVFTPETAMVVRILARQPVRVRSFQVIGSATPTAAPPPTKSGS